MASYAALAGVLLVLAGCGGRGAGVSEPDGAALAAELDRQRALLAAPLKVAGQVRAANGASLPGVRVQLGAAVAVTDADGRFELSVTERRNALLQASASGYRDEFQVVMLQRPAHEAAVTLPTVVLSEQDPGRARLLFGGDVAFGRRFLDTRELTPRDQVPADDPAALIQASDPGPGSIGVVQWLKPYFDEADWASVNLESPVTDQPSTPHPTKDFAFFTLPGSLQALTWLGVDYVALGNNHVRDYLDPGVADTLHQLAAWAIPNSGAGMDGSEAFGAYRASVGMTAYGLISATSVSGSQHGAAELLYVAGAGRPGAADLRDEDAVRAAVRRERLAGQAPIVQLHAGKEYTDTPTAITACYFEVAAGAEKHWDGDSGTCRAGAVTPTPSKPALLIGHHPHVAQGVAWHNGDVLAVHSLGNLAFDQDRLETMFGLLARVDLRGDRPEALRLLPVYIKDYRPRLLGGDLAARFLRAIGGASELLVYPHGGQGWVALAEGDAEAAERSLDVEIAVPADGRAVLDLRELAAAEESVAGIEAPEGIALRLGRDILQHGEFEDYDGDETGFEAARWDLSGVSRFLCADQAYRGAAALCLARTADNSEVSVAAFRNRIRVPGDAIDRPNKDLTLHGRVRGDNAGAASVVARYYASAGPLEFGEQSVVELAAGDYPWRALRADLHMPADSAAQPAGENSARALRLFLRHAPPADGAGLVAFDDLAVIAWEAAVVAGSPIATPHASDFIEVSGPPGTLIALRLTLRRYAQAPGGD